MWAAAASDPGFATQGSKVSSNTMSKQQYLDTQNFVNQYRDIEPPVFEAPAGLPEQQYAQWVMFQSRMPYLEIQGLNLPYQEMYHEALALQDRFVDHREGCGRGWRSLCVHGTSAEQTDAPSAYGIQDSPDIYHWTDVQDRCPVTVNAFKNLFHYTHYMRVRYMWLEPNGFIEPHVDAQNFVFGAVNISLNNPEGCVLTTELGTVPYKDSGSAFFLNTSYRHAVWNNSDKPRIHMIVHGSQDQRFWNPLVIRSYEQSRFYSKSSNSHSQELQAA